jgi:NADH dehydrogenase
MKVFVTGGTGFVGQGIVRHLIDAGHSARIFVRKPQADSFRQWQSTRQVELHAGDITNASSLDSALVGMEAIIHLVGIIAECGRSTFENVHTLGTKNVLAAARSEGIRRFVHMSALGTRANAVSRYHQTKWAAEQAVRESRLDYTIFRPSLIYGPKDHFVNLFARSIRLSPFVPVMGSSPAHFQPVAVENIARAFVRALVEPRAIGQTYDLCGGEQFTFDEMLDEIMAALCRRSWKIHISVRVARAQAALLEWFFPRVLRKPPPLNRDQLVMLQEGSVGAPRAADQLFGLKHPKFKESIAEYLRARRQTSIP